MSGAGTDANVFVVLFGEHGDSGELHLKDSETNKDPFETAQTDVFTVANLLDLGRLFKLRVWHDNKGIYCDMEDCTLYPQMRFSSILPTSLLLLLSSAAAAADGSCWRCTFLLALSCDLASVSCGCKLLTD